MEEKRDKPKLAGKLSGTETETQQRQQEQRHRASIDHNISGPCMISVCTFFFFEFAPSSVSFFFFFVLFPFFSRKSIIMRRQGRFLLLPVHAFPTLEYRGRDWHLLFAGAKGGR